DVRVQHVGKGVYLAGPPIGGPACAGHGGPLLDRLLHEVQIPEEASDAVGALGQHVAAGAVAEVGAIGADVGSAVRRPLHVVLEDAGRLDAEDGLQLGYDSVAELAVPVAREPLGPGIRRARLEAPHRDCRSGTGGGSKAGTAVGGGVVGGSEY